MCVDIVGSEGASKGERLCPRRQNWTAVIKSPCCVEVEKCVVREPREGEVLVRSLVSGIQLVEGEMNVYRGTAPQWRMRRDPVTGLFAPSDEPLDALP